ncbi:MULTISPECIES: hypothetical protein [Deefgea]|uniref:Transposase n=1 Tax=Deefgea chitinilytica TaxID=570276 RepID=A0ABS2CE38_9NEIS|nr:MULTISPECIES: hypothetical protein [Deefgea]MBM5572418.1 hypothetical protein [Deefgea chitinilytica]MBM9889654.1 hypothetical protein [Deefgea sp. CFH1-16]
MKKAAQLFTTQLKTRDAFKKTLAERMVGKAPFAWLKFATMPTNAK